MFIYYTMQMHKMKFRTKVRKVLVHLVLSIKARIYSGCFNSLLSQCCQHLFTSPAQPFLHLLDYFIYIYLHFDATHQQSCIIIDHIGLQVEHTNIQRWKVVRIFTNFKFKKYISTLSICQTFTPLFS